MSPSLRKLMRRAVALVGSAVSGDFLTTEASEQLTTETSETLLWES
jgi:hypothetical protein